MRTEVVTCGNCGSLYPANAGEDFGHDLIPCPLCYSIYDIDKKMLDLQSKNFDLVRLVDSREDRIKELEEKIKDLQDLIDDIAEELDEL